MHLAQSAQNWSWYVWGTGGLQVSYPRGHEHRRAGCAPHWPYGSIGMGKMPPDSPTCGWQGCWPHQSSKQCWKAGPNPHYSNWQSRPHMLPGQCSREGTGWGAKGSETALKAGVCAEELSLPPPTNLGMVGELALPSLG